MKIIPLYNHPEGDAVYIKDGGIAYLLDVDGNQIDVLDADALDEILTAEEEQE